jgi:hypothetical protein
LEAFIFIIYLDCLNLLGLLGGDHLILGLHVGVLFSVVDHNCSILCPDTFLAVILDLSSCRGVALRWKHAVVSWVYIVCLFGTKAFLYQAGCGLANKLDSVLYLVVAREAFLIYVLVFLRFEVALRLFVSRLLGTISVITRVLRLISCVSSLRAEPFLDFLLDAGLGVPVSPPSSSENCGSSCRCKSGGAKDDSLELKIKIV